MAPGSVDRLLRRLCFIALPPSCLLCGDLPDNAVSDLCDACRQDFVANDSACARCALPLSRPAALCGECLRDPPPFDAAFVPFVYAHPLDLLITRLKFGRSLAAGRAVGELCIAALSGALANGAIAQLPDALLPVPLHTGRLRERGYNQALELARPLATALGLPLMPGILQRERPTAAQTDLGAAARRRSPRGAFSFVAPPGRPVPDHVALVDDVMTTGATLRECARVLKRAGVARVDVWAMARAPRRR
jgi:ComF family protein